jgi:hypothetical protein
VVYLLTFNCYGTHMRGDEAGSVDRVREGRGGPIEASPALVDYGHSAMTHPEARLDLAESFVVLNAIRETCAFRKWTLRAAHVRSTHAHLVVDGVSESSNAIRDFTAYASRKLNCRGVRRRWARGGNAKLLRGPRAVSVAIRYVAERQGPPMALYVAPARCDPCVRSCEKMWGMASALPPPFWAALPGLLEVFVFNATTPGKSPAASQKARPTS